MDEFQILNNRAIILKESLKSVLDTKYLLYHDVKNISDAGIYFVYRDNKIIYIGKTERTGKVRLRELASDYRSHTFNNKLLAKELEKNDLFFGKRLPKNAKFEFIKSEILTENLFAEYQKRINSFIKNKLKFKFQAIETDLISLEHFAIAIYRPEFND
jgi:hypothetical protein